MCDPLLYEINTRCWLRDLSEKAAHSITLGNVPDSEFAEWRRLGFTHIWLMGAWTSGPRARAEALKHFGSQALPDWTEAEVVGSPYAIAEYLVPPALGGENGLRTFRRNLHQHGLKLLLDFVPNHVGVDHPWVSREPDLFVQTAIDLPGTFGQATGAGMRRLAHGKDPNFAAWTDTVQLDYRLPAARSAITEVLQSIAERCDGVRCDMAMLVLNDVFARTWHQFPVANHEPPETEFWAAAIVAVKQAYPSFLFLAEAYWDLEPRLQALGFDYTYDKELYDRLVARDAPGVQRRLLGKTPEFIARSAHFLENHDEPRVASILSLAEHRAAALLILGLPGMRFLHEGQIEGGRNKIPVQLLRRGVEPNQAGIKQVYEQLLTALPGTAVGQGRGALIRPRAAWVENPTVENFVIVQWQKHPPDFNLVVVNLAPHRSQCFAPLSIQNLARSDWALKDLLSQEKFGRSGEWLQNQGLYLDLPAHGIHLFHVEPTS
jgi:hypothetical protein